MADERLFKNNPTQ